MALRISLQKKLNRDRNRDEIISCDTFTQSVRTTRSRSRSSSAVHKDTSHAGQKLVSPELQVESPDNNSGAASTRPANLISKVLPQYSEPIGSSDGTKLFFSTPPVKSHANEISETISQCTNESYSPHYYTGSVYTPSPKGILKKFLTAVTPSPSPKAKSISFGGTFFSPMPSTPAQKSYKASPQSGTETESLGVRNLRRKCRAPNCPSHDDRSSQDPVKKDYEESLKTMQRPGRRNKRKSTSSLETSASEQLGPKLDTRTSTNVYSTKQTTSGGCVCKGYCNPSICSCAQNGIFCMVGQYFLSQKKECVIILCAI